MVFKSTRSLTATLTALVTGASVSAGAPISDVTVIYTDTAPGNKLDVQVLMNDAVSWVTVQSVTTLASGLISLAGPFLDVRAAVSAHTVSGTITADIFVQG